MDSKTRAELEGMADRLEMIARGLPEWREKSDRIEKLFAVAWDLKQIARANTNSAGI